MTPAEIHARIDQSAIRAGQHAAKALLAITPVKDDLVYSEIHALLTDLAELSVLCNVLARMEAPEDPDEEVA